jgi:hypothetical protein
VNARLVSFKEAPASNEVARLREVNDFRSATMRSPATHDGLPDVGNSAVRTRDLILLCIFIFTLMYCWHERSYFDYRLEPTWFVQNSVREVARRGRRVLDLVPPLLTDLDENGRQELVALVSSDADDSDDGDEGAADPTAGFRLQLLDVYQDPSLVLDDVFHPRVMAGMPLSGSKVRVLHRSASHCAAPR